MSDRRYDAAKSALLAHRGVGVTAGEGFGSGVLTVGGHILAMPAGLRHEGVARGERALGHQLTTSFDPKRMCHDSPFFYHSGDETRRG